jgi:nucleoside phosphorylase
MGLPAAPEGVVRTLSSLSELQEALERFQPSLSWRRDEWRIKCQGLWKHLNAAQQGLLELAKIEPSRKEHARWALELRDASDLAQRNLAALMNCLNALMKGQEGPLGEDRRHHSCFGPAVRKVLESLDTLHRVAEEEKMEPENSVDAVILTALSEEASAVLRYVDTKELVQNKSREFHRATVGPQQVVILCMHQMGNINAAIVAQQAIGVWNPAHILMTGIAGGVKKPNERLLGDVLIPEQVVGYELGKQTQEGTERRYQVYRPAKPLLEVAKQLTPASWATSIHAPRPDGTTGRTLPQAHFGVILSGEKVVTDSSLIGELKEDWVQSIGVEMESIGVALAAYENERAPGFLVVKGISDWADPQKADDWRQYASEASAAFAIALLRAMAPKEEVRDTILRSQAIRKGVRPHYSGKVKIRVCQRLVYDWRNLSDYFDVPDHARAQFQPGYEAQGVWQWLEMREKLGELRDALPFIGREDLVPLLEDDHR